MEIKSKYNVGDIVIYRFGENCYNNAITVGKIVSVEYSERDCRWEYSVNAFALDGLSTKPNYRCIEETDIISKMNVNQRHSDLEHFFAPWKKKQNQRLFN